MNAPEPGPAPQSRQCFARARPARRADDPDFSVDTACPPPAACALGPHSAQPLPGAVAQALADTLPFLLCGEESAVHAFGRRWKGQDHRREALRSIAGDEARHASWLQALARCLPAPARAPDAARMSAFFGGLLTREPARHFGHIAALDRSVCDILRPLVLPNGALADAPDVRAVLRAIHQDEARHVRVARDCALELGLTVADQHRLDLQVADALAALLSPVRASLHRLGVTGRIAPAPAPVPAPTPELAARADA